MRICLATLWLGLWLAGCENYRVIDYPLPAAPARPVVIGLMASQGVQTVYGGWTIPVGEFAPDPAEMDSLTLRLLHPDGVAQSLTRSEATAYALAPSPPLMAGQAYTLALDCESCAQPLLATDTLPVFVNIDAVETAFDSSARVYRTNVQLVDPAGPTYYGINQRLLGSDSLPYVSEYDIGFFPTGVQTERLFTDEGYEKQVLPLALEPLTHFGAERISGIRIYLYSFSRSSYRWKESLGSFEGSWGDYLAAPVEVVSNFSHRVGFWGLYQVDSVTVYWE
jgi:hypothetical protein